MRWNFPVRNDFVLWDDYQNKVRFTDDFFFQQNARRQSVKNLKFFA